MTIAFWCVFVAGVMPILWQGIAKSLIIKNFSNRSPRLSLANAEGLAKRCTWAHDNSWEAFAPFAAGVIIASIAGADSNLIDTLALVFIVARLCYGFAYMANKSKIRSIVWFVGFLTTLALYLAGSKVI